MIANPLEGSIGKDDVVLVIGGEIADIGEREIDARLYFVAEAVAQRRCPIDHRGRQIETERSRGGAASREFHRMLARAAAEIDDLIGAVEREPRKNHLDGFGAVAAKAVIEVWIPVSH